MLLCVFLAGRFQGRSLRNADVCGHYGVCESGFWCGDVDAKQCFKGEKHPSFNGRVAVSFFMCGKLKRGLYVCCAAPEPEEVCSEEDMCLEDLEECGPETYCKYDERCVKDTECYAKWEEYSKKGELRSHEVFPRVTVAKVILRINAFVLLHITDHKEGEEVQESSCYKCEPIGKFHL